MTVRSFACVLAALMVGSSAAAQSYALDEGSVLVGGTASFTSSVNSVNGVDSDRVTEFALAPFVQYFFVPRLAIGAQLSFNRVSFRGGALSTVGVGPAVTYYFGSAPSRVWPFIGGGLQFQMTSAEDDADEPSVFGYRGEAGMLFMLSGTVGIDAALYYQRLRQETDLLEVDTDTFGLAIGIAAFVF